MKELVEHIAVVYMHKTESIRNGRPKSWPPKLDPEVPSLTLMRTALGDLLAEFTPRQPADSAHTWYDPDQTVGFWIRRMAHETVIHRVDAELGAGVPLGPIDAELAVDGVDELLRIFIAWSSHKWAAEMGDRVPTKLPKPVAVRTGDTTWVVKPVGGSIDIEDEPDADLAVTISGEPVPLLLWLWRRGDDAELTFEGDAEAARAFHELIEEFTQ